VTNARPHTGLREPSSVQETALDLLWIADGVACFAGAGAARLYRAVLALAGPPEAFAGSDHAERALAAYAAFLNSLEVPLQFLVTAAHLDVDGYAAGWDARERALAGAMAELAREHARWAREELAGLRLLERQILLVVAAEGAAAAAGALVPALAGGLPWRRRERAAEAEASASATLGERCARLQAALADAGVRSSRLDDAALARVYRVGWGHDRAGEQRFDRDLAAFVAATRRSA
jgi:hypothetical protein